MRIAPGGVGDEQAFFLGSPLGEFFRPEFQQELARAGGRRDLSIVSQRGWGGERFVGDCFDGADDPGDADFVDEDAGLRGESFGIANGERAGIGVAEDFFELLAGDFFVEYVYAWPGIGRLVVSAILVKDYPVVQGFLLLAATAYVLINLTVDLLYTAIDPRIRFQGRE